MGKTWGSQKDNNASKKADCAGKKQHQEPHTRRNDEEERGRAEKSPKKQDKYLTKPMQTERGHKVWGHIGITEYIQETTRWGHEPGHTSTEQEGAQNTSKECARAK